MSVSESSENTCVVCFKNVLIFSIGECDHPVCYECSTRMRVLCRQNECPICRHDLPKVIFKNEVALYRTINSGNYLMDKKFKICFANFEIQAAYNKLLEHTCARCPNRPAFRTFQNLKDHMRKEHELQYCELCVDNLMIFSGERRSYTRQELGQHRRKGDTDDRSHRGHPLCEFCDQRYMDNDELYRHLRRDHLFCHFCDADGFHHYYPSYDALRHHFRSEHFLCEEGECIDEKFTPVFRSEIDLKAHRASVHGRALGKAGTKQARTLELEFTLKPRPDAARRGAARSQQAARGDEDAQGAVGGRCPALEDGGGGGGGGESGTFQHAAPPPNMSEFPSLGGSAAGAQSSRGPRNNAVTIRTHGPPGAVTDANFPALGPDSLPGCKTVRLSVNSGPRDARAAGNNVSIHVNHRSVPQASASAPQNDFPALARRSGEPAQKLRPATDDFPSLSKGKPEMSKAKWTTAGKSKTAAPAAATAPAAYVGATEDYPRLAARFSNSVAVSSGASWEQTRGASAPKISTSSFSAKASSASRDATTGATLMTEANKAKVKKKKPKQAEPKPPGKEPPETKKKKEFSEPDGPQSKRQEPAEAEPAKRKEPAESSSSRSVAAEPGLTNGRKRSELTISSLAGPDTPSKAPPESPRKISSRDFPALGRPPGFDGRAAEKTVKASESKSSSAAPPGFGPPPGFSVTCSSFARPAPATPAAPNGLTFTSSSGQSYAIRAPANETATTFQPPPNFSRRNQELVGRVMSSLPGDELSEFRQMSTLFRQGNVGADTFVAHCADTMGSAAFAHIVPEMLVLLPDVAKQQELFAVLRGHPAARLLEACATCGQVVSSADLRHHAGSHTLANHFPALGAESSATAWVGK